jgi:hypothetical protein
MHEQARRGGIAYLFIAGCIHKNILITGSVNLKVHDSEYGGEFQQQQHMGVYIPPLI